MHFYYLNRSLTYKSENFNTGSYYQRPSKYLVEHYERFYYDRITFFFLLPPSEMTLEEKRVRDLELSEVFMRIFSIEWPSLMITGRLNASWLTVLVDKIGLQRVKKGEVPFLYRFSFLLPVQLAF